MTTEIECLEHELDAHENVENFEVADGVYAIVALRDLVVFPGTVAPLYVGRASSIAALDHAIHQQNNSIMLVTQKDPEQEHPSYHDLFPVGCLGTLLQVLKMQDGTVKVLVEGTDQSCLSESIPNKDYLSARITVQSDLAYDSNKIGAVFTQTLLSHFEKLVELHKKIPDEIRSAVKGIDDLSRLIDTIASHLPLKQELKLEVLSELDVVKRAELLIGMMANEISMIQVEKKIHQRVKKRMDETQLKYFFYQKSLTCFKTS